MTKLTDQRQVRNFIWLCTLVYFTSYLSRVNLSATLVEIVNSGFAAKNTAALALTVCSVTYGAGQVVSGWLGDRFKPQNVISVGFLITGCVNFLVGLLPNDSLLIPLWAVNGFAQSLMWPPLVAIMAANLSMEDYEKACVRVSWGSSFGTIAVYLLAPAVIRFLDIRWVFILCAAGAMGMLICWRVKFDARYSVPAAAAKKDNQVNAAPSGFQPKMLLLMASVFLCIVLQGFLRDGVTSWTPSYISDIFQLSSSASILSGVILPLFSILCFLLASVIHRRFFRNELLCSGVIFGVGSIAAVTLFLFEGSNIVLNLLCLALLAGSMHGVNLILLCIVPPHFAKHGHVSLISGILNAGTYVGSAVSAYGTALFSEAFGWKNTILLWAAVALLGTVLCLFLKKKWAAFKD